MVSVLRPGIFSIRLNAVVGWTRWYDSVDPALVSDMRYRDRAFCLTDRSHPYVLHFSYYDPEEDWAIAPTVNLGSVGMAFYNQTKLTHDITARYQSMTALKADHDLIVKYQDILRQHHEEVKAEVLKKILK